MKRKINVAVLIIAVFFFFAIIFLGCASRFFPDLIYRAIYKPQEVNYTVGEIKEVKLKKNDYIVYGTYKGSAVKWRYVFKEDLPVFQSENIIDFMKYDDDNSSWNDSFLKRYLNEENTFSFADKEKNINGEIFILSKSQCKKINQNERKKSPTVEAIKNTNTRYVFARKYSWYWTSSGIETNSLSVAAVTQDGGFYKTPAYDALTGVCPALKSNGEEVLICGGDGSRENPYIIKGMENDLAE